MKPSNWVVAKKCDSTCHFEDCTPWRGPEGLVQDRTEAVVTLSRFFTNGCRLGILFLLLAFWACDSPSSPADSPADSPRTLYVSRSGDDQNQGTISAPWRTLRHAVAQLRAGDTLYVRGGTYTSEDDTIDSELGVVPSGTSWSKAITIAGYPSEVVTILPPDRQGIRLTTSAPHYLIFQDLIIDGSNLRQGGTDNIYIGVGAHHNRFQRIESRNSRANGMVFSSTNGNSPFNEVLNSKIHHNGLSGGINQGYGAYIFTSDNVFDGNEVYDNGGYGLHFFNVGDRSVNRNVIRNNRIYGNGVQGGSNYGIVVASGDENQVHDNLIYGNRGGILVYVGSSNAMVFKNTLSDNAPFEAILVQDATGTTVRDNIVNGAEVVDNGAGTILVNNH